jgi:hypothetical protein
MPAHDVNPRPIVWSGLALGGAVVLAVLGVFLLLHVWAMAPQGERLESQGANDAPGATLQSAPQPELAQYRAAKRHQLESSGWVDEAHGIVHIPIADAMDLLAQRATAGASSPKEVR